MRRSNKLFASVLCAAAVFTLALTGCAGKSGSNNSSASEPVSQAASSTAKASSAVSSATSSAASSAASSTASSEKSQAASSKASDSSAESSAKTSSAASSAKTSSAASSASSSKTSAATTNSTTVKGTLYTKSGVNMRKGPGTDYEVVVEVPGKAKVNVYGESRNWSEVEYNGKRGFISNYYLLEKPDATETVAASTEKETVALGTMYVTSGVNLRKGPGKDYDVLTAMPKGAAVEVTGSENGWIKVKYNGQEGYTGSSFLSKTKPQ